MVSVVHGDCHYAFELQRRKQTRLNALKAAAAKCLVARNPANIRVGLLTVNGALFYQARCEACAFVTDRYELSIGNPRRLITGTV